MKNPEEVATKLHSRSVERLGQMLEARGVEFEVRRRVLDYRPDFYFPGQVNRIIEVDAREHLSQGPEDLFRQKHLKKYGYRVMRIRASDVMIQPEWLMHRVLMFLKIPHKPVSRAVRVRRKKIRNTIPNTPEWAKIPKLTKDHLLKARDWKPRSNKQQQVEFQPSKPRPVKVVKAIRPVTESHEPSVTENVSSPSD